MKISLRDILKRIGVIIMICFVGLMIANKVMYTHIHKLEDGSIVVHAHPYDKSENENSGKTHHHVKAELFFLQSLELLFYIAILSAFLYLGFLVLEIFSCSVVLYRGNNLFLLLGRAPPCK